MFRRESTRIGMKVEDDMAEYHDFKNSLVEKKRKQTMNLVAQGSSGKGVTIFRQTSGIVLQSSVSAFRSVPTRSLPIGSEIYFETGTTT